MRTGTWRRVFAGLAAFTGVLLLPRPSLPADHNDPNAINSIFSDIPPNAADLYDLFGFPVESRSGEERVVVALTFAAIPKAGEFDHDLLYRILFASNPRPVPPMEGDHSLDAVLQYFDAVKDKYLRLKPYEVRVRVGSDNRANVEFLDFPGGTFTQTIDTNKAVQVSAPDGSRLDVFIGGRDDAFFNDLPGFFRSINYAPQYYQIRQADLDHRELPIPKTLLELEGNALFNDDPNAPGWGRPGGFKKPLPPGPYTWSGTRYKKDANGNYRFVYSGKDAQAGRNVNAVIVELPLSYLTKSPQSDRIVNAWGESWVLKASGKIKTIPDDGAMAIGAGFLQRSWLYGGLLIALGIVWIVFVLVRRAAAQPRPSIARAAGRVAIGVLAIVAGLVLGLLHEVRPGQPAELDRAPRSAELRDYKLVDTDGQPFADAGLNEREDSRQVGANNFFLGTHFILRLAHLGWGFGPSVTALGLKTSFNHDNSPISIHRTYTAASLGDAFQRAQKMLFQEMRMPDNTWNRHGLNIPLRRAVDVFVPNVCAIDMDTTGTWPFGRRLEDQVATRFLSIFLDMSAEFNGHPYNIESLQDPAVLAALPLEPKTPPNPLKNDKEFLIDFPYLADPWPSGESYPTVSR